MRRLRYKGPVFLISGATGRGTRELAEAVMRFLEQQTPVRNSQGQAAHRRREAASCASATCATWVRSSEGLLAQIGIRSAEELRRRGAVRAYVELKQRGR